MDKQEILKELGNLPEEIYDSIVESFFQESRLRLQGIEQAISQRDWFAIIKFAHGIKGSSANLRLMDIQLSAKALEDSARQSDAPQILKSFEVLKSLIPPAA